MGIPFAGPRKGNCYEILYDLLHGAKNIFTIFIQNLIDACRSTCESKIVESIINCFPLVNPILNSVAKTLLASFGSIRYNQNVKFNCTSKMTLFFFQNQKKFW